jgi:hypothetical protein
VLIHPRHHQYPLGSGILNDRWNETVGIIFELLHTAPANLMKMKVSKGYQTATVLVHRKIIHASTCSAT